MDQVAPDPPSFLSTSPSLIIELTHPRGKLLSDSTRVCPLELARLLGRAVRGGAQGLVELVGDQVVDDDIALLLVLPG